jgi:hypothetical protein
MLRSTKPSALLTNAHYEGGCEIVAAPPAKVWPSRPRHSQTHRPSFFLVGAPKTGTTAMNDYLARHPAIYMAPKELHYFSEDVLYGPPLSSRDLEWYLSQFAAAENRKLIGEASVFYLSSAIAAERIHKFEPNAKIIIHVRNPVDLLESYHSELLFLGFEEISDLLQALDLESERRMGWRIPRFCPSPRILHYSDIVSFSSQIERFIGTFGSCNVLVNVFDDFVKNPEAVYRSTLAFLQMDQASEPNFEIVNPNKVVRSRLIRRVLRQPPNYLRLLPKPIRASVRAWLWRINTRYVPRIEIDPVVRARIKHKYAGEVARLSDLLGRDLTHWSQ